VSSVVSPGGVKMGRFLITGDDRTIINTFEGSHLLTADDILVVVAADY
jgi:hypothetical protein